MVYHKLKPGDVVVTDFPGFQHWSIVSDKRCGAGKPYLISATARTGTVTEEPWDIVTSGNHSYAVDIQLQADQQTLLARSRGQIGRWSYNLVSHNCEHFVKWSGGMKTVSKQVISGVIGATLGAIVTGVATRKAFSLKGIGAAVATAYVAVASARAKKQPQASKQKAKRFSRFSRSSVVND